MSALIIIITIGISLVMAQSFEFEASELETDETLWGMYVRWRSNNVRALEVSSRAEEHRRFDTFKDNALHVHEVNQKSQPFKLRLNKFADLSSEEFLSLHGNNQLLRRAPGAGNRTETSDVMKSLPPSLDWRKKGSVLPIKDQRQCSSCWAFSAVAVVEGLQHIKTGRLVSLSEQQMVDCAHAKHIAGCTGGYMDDAFDFIAKKGGIATEQDYPYQGTDGKCQRQLGKSAAVRIDGFIRVPKNNEQALLKAVAKQPISAAIDCRDMQFYSEGVLTGKCRKKLNHAVTIVGYGETAEGIKFWVARNSWGESWGEKGYIRMQRGISDKSGMCGIAKLASYPVVH